VTQAPPRTIGGGTGDGRTPVRPAPWRSRCSRPHAGASAGGKRGRRGAGGLARTGALRVSALDAAMPFDFEHKAQQLLARAGKLRVGVVGFGTFGQFLAKRLVAAGHEARPPAAPAPPTAGGCRP